MGHLAQVVSRALSGVSLGDSEVVNRGLEALLF
jgi:hypothetical protein